MLEVRKVGLRARARKIGFGARKVGWGLGIGFRALGFKAVAGQPSGGWQGSGLEN